MNPKKSSGSTSTYWKEEIRCNNKNSKEREKSFFIESMYAYCTPSAATKNPGIESAMTIVIIKSVTKIDSSAKAVSIIIKPVVGVLGQLISSMIGIHKEGWRQGLQVVVKNVHQVMNLFSRLLIYSTNKFCGSLARCLELNLYTVQSSLPAQLSSSVSRESSSSEESSLVTPQYQRMVQFRDLQQTSTDAHSHRIATCTVYIFSPFPLWVG
jgi:hypothetical protein